MTALSQPMQHNDAACSKSRLPRERSPLKALRPLFCGCHSPHTRRSFRFNSRERRFADSKKSFIYVWGRVNTSF